TRADGVESARIHLVSAWAAYRPRDGELLHHVSVRLCRTPRHRRCERFRSTPRYLSDAARGIDGGVVCTGRLTRGGPLGAAPPTTSSLRAPAARSSARAAGWHCRAAL